MARARFIADLLPTHLDDLAFLGAQRRQAMASSLHTLKTFAEINDRMSAHLQGLLVAPASHLQPWLTPRLAEPDRDDVFAAAYTLLHLPDPEATRAVMAAFSCAQGAALAGLRDALSLAPLAATQAELQSALDQARPDVAVAAAVALANHRQLDPRHGKLTAWLVDDEPTLATWAWRAAHLADVAAPAVAPARPLPHGVGHTDAQVRHAAWHAAAWVAPQATLGALRQRAQLADPVAWHWLAVLGAPDDVPLLQQAVRATEAAEPACALLARYGHPMALPALVQWMAPHDLPRAVAAGEAFTRLTAWDIRGERSRMPVADDADDFTREMAPDVWVPDAARAAQLMAQHSAHWQQGSRWCQGRRLDGPVDAGLLAQLDLQARWDVVARAALSGIRMAAPAPVF